MRIISKSFSKNSYPGKFTSVVLLSDEDVRKNRKVGKRNNFWHFLGNWFNSEALSHKWEQSKAVTKKSLSTFWQRFLAIFSEFVQFRGAVWEARQANKEQEKVNCKKIVVVLIFLNFCRVCIVQKPLLVSEKNEEVTKNRKVQINAAAIFLRRIIKFEIACNPGHKWEIKPKEIKRSLVNQRIEPMGRNFRRPGPVK